MKKKADESRCREFRQGLQSLLQGERCPALEGHLQDCTRCQSLFQASQRMIQGIESLAPFEPPEGFSAQVMVRARQVAKSRARWMAVGVAIIILALAGMVLTLVFSLDWLWWIRQAPACLMSVMDFAIQFLLRVVRILVLVFRTDLLYVLAPWLYWGALATVLILGIEIVVAAMLGRLTVSRCPILRKEY